MTDAPAYFSAGDLRGYATDIFLAHGLSADDAMLVADCLVQANLRGVDSHGVSRIPVYAERLRRKLVEPRPDIRIERVATAAASVDGGGGMGFVVGTRAMGRGHGDRHGARCRPRLDPPQHTFRRRRHLCAAGDREEVHEPRLHQRLAGHAGLGRSGAVPRIEPLRGGRSGRQNGAFRPRYGDHGDGAR